MLGFEVAQSTVSKYMVRGGTPPSQSWKTLPSKPRAGDRCHSFIIVRLARRDLVWINVTPHPTADWIARQITEAFPWNEGPRYLIRDRDQVCVSKTSSVLRIA